MTTRGTLATEIMDDLERSSTSDNTRVLAAISSAIKYYQPKRFFFNESRSVTFDTVADTATYSWTTIGTEFYAIDGAFITDSSNVLELRPEHYTDFETPTATTSRPIAYARLADGLILWHTPDNVYSVRLDGHVKVEEPSDDGEAGNSWFTEAYELIHCSAKWRLYAHVWIDVEMALAMQAAEKLAAAALRSATTAKSGTGRLVPTEF